MATSTATARNFSAASENRIHSDEIAKRFGFTGALVPGVAVFGHLSAPLSRRYGERWLAGSSVATRFLKPAYHGDTLTLIDSEVDASVNIECRNAADVLLATASCTLESSAPDVERTVGSSSSAARVEISWDTVHVNEPFS